MKENISPEIYETLNERMKELGMSQSDLAREIGTSRQYINQILTLRRGITLRTFMRILNALGLKVELSLE